MEGYQAGKDQAYNEIRLRTIEQTLSILNDLEKRVDALEQNVYDTPSVDEKPKTDQRKGK